MGSWEENTGVCPESAVSHWRFSSPKGPEPVMRTWEKTELSGPHSKLKWTNIQKAMEAAKLSGAQILVETERSRQRPEQKMDAISTEVNLLRTNLCKVNERFFTTKEQVNKLKLMKEAEELWANTRCFRDLTLYLNERLEDAEGRSRRCSLRCVGFHERSKEEAPEMFLESWLKCTLDPGKLFKIFIDEWVLRALVLRPPQELLQEPL
ncbi:hypothetical protein NDU88_002074 [Pleurodeles waltl]|uniref:Uncharacterized protein n=1 Tax=Pleurodeles waltl TaxID=8319 RepID=A0AAV7MNJ1_PLEWA|nr:hypothetical protein NDU88_002074 [Pleurodeles waltl]